MAFFSVRNNKINVIKVLRDKSKLEKKYAEYVKLNKDLLGNADDLPKFDCFRVHSPLHIVKKRDTKMVELDFNFSIHDPYFSNDNYQELKSLLRSCLVDVNYFNPIIQANSNTLAIKDQALHVQVKAFVKEEHIACSYVSHYLIYEFFIKEWFRKVSKYSVVLQAPIGTKSTSVTLKHVAAQTMKGIPWLIVHTSNAFQNTLQASNENITVKRFELGTLVNATNFYSHFVFESNPAMSVEADFYHDTRQVQLRFGRKHALAFRYSNIRQIMVDKTDATTIYLNLINPPAIYAYVEEGNGTNKSYVKKRVTNFFYLEGDVIGRSNTVSLKITNNYEAREILSRLYVKTNQHPIAYVVMRCHHLDAPTTVPRLELPAYQCTYLLNAIMRRSFVMQLQNLHLDEFQSLMFMLNRMCLEDCHVLYSVLKEVLHALDEGVNVDYRQAIEQLFDTYSKRKNEQDNEERFLTPPRTKKVWRVFITPTRQVFYPAEIGFENRVIRKYNADFTLRVSFRDDDYGKLNNIASQCEDDFIRNIVVEPLQEGITVGDRKFEFLGWSNSQLRDHGVYMYAEDEKGNTAESIRSWLGNFSEIRSVSRFMARMGQCFSHSEDAIAVPLDSSMVTTEPDIVGGFNPASGKPYVFSDGVGRISSRLMKETATVLGYEYVPSAIQFRCAGYKGMLTVDPTLTDRDIVFRESQKKFVCSESQRLEVVAKSSPVPVLLNRQLITILDQKGVPAAVFLKIQQDMLKNLTEMLLSDVKAAEYLTAHSVIPKIKYNDIKNVGISLNIEPFFRNMLLAQHRVAIDGIRKKSRLAIDPGLGRNMFGVLDESGKLCYGQVFVQYTDAIDGYETNRETTIVNGEVLVTKNPCLQLGDVRMFKAVDVEELHHIVDCIVFPQKGPRPHPNEMAGSDLDGDEYTVLWEKGLFFEGGNSPASNFPVPIETTQFSKITVIDMLHFLYQYIINDQVGLIGNAHLALADDLHYGLKNPLCEKIAHKFAIAVDFAKNGQKVQLDYNEKPKKYPDFMEKGSLANTYCSKRVLGKLYRICKDYEEENVVSLSTKKYNEVDMLLVHPGWEKYREAAIKSSLKYKKLLSLLLNTYGIEDEFQACGKAYISVRSRAERKELMDIEEIVSRSLRQLWKTFEEEFLEEFYSQDVSLDTLTEEMFMKASAWYCVTYLNPNDTFLSFPWICWKYLVNLRSRYQIVKVAPSFNPFLEKIQANLKEVVKNFNYLKPLTQATQQRCVDFVELYNKNSELQTLRLDDVTVALRILLRWAVSVGIVDLESVLFMEDRSHEGSPVNFLMRMFFKSLVAIQSDRCLSCIELIVAFLENCASLRFLTKDNNVSTYSLRKQKFLGKKSMAAYHRLAVSGNLDAIGLKEPGFDYKTAHEFEMEPMKIEKDYVKMHVELWRLNLLKISRATDINVREIGRYYIVSASGSKRSLRMIEKHVLNLLNVV